VVFPKDKEAYIYQGLTRPDPTVLDYYIRNDDTQESAVTYSFTNFDTSPKPTDPLITLLAPRPLAMRL
jgi:hypothetical protein